MFLTLRLQMKGYVQYRQKQNWVNLSVMNVYAPTDESDDVGKDWFYKLWKESITPDQIITKW